MGTIGEAPSESETWSRAMDGDADAFGTIFDKHRDRVFGHSLRRVRSPHDAEDVTALVFLETWRRRQDVRVVDGSIIGWLLVTANNVVHNYARTLRRHQAAMAKLPPPEPHPNHADEVLGRINDRVRDDGVRAAFALLSQRDQDVLTLCVLEELTVAQAGKALGIPDGTVKSRLSRAKVRLSNLLAPTLGALDTTVEGSAQ